MAALDEVMSEASQEFSDGLEGARQLERREDYLEERRSSQDLASPGVGRARLDSPLSEDEAASPSGSVCPASVAGSLGAAGPLDPPEQPEEQQAAAEAFEPVAAPLLSRSPSSLGEGLPPHSPGHGVWLQEPASIDEPLLLLDEARMAEEIAQLRAELAEARAAGKADRAALEALEHGAEALEQECDSLHAMNSQLEQENRVLRLQLQDHHGIMAADWEQTLSFKEQLRQEKAAHERLAGEVAELREAAAARTEEAAMLRQDAGRWRLLCRPVDLLFEVEDEELEAVTEVATAAVPLLSAEARARSRRVQVQLHSELEQQLCAVCRDAKKEVLFLPCLHLCVCERCRGRLKPYRCPICQEPVQGTVGRVHF